MAPGKLPGGQQNASGPFGDDKPPAVHGKGPAGPCWGASSGAPSGGTKAPFMVANPATIGSTSGEIHRAADSDIGPALFQKHGAHDDGGEPRGAGGDGGTDRAGGAGHHGHLSAHHVDAGVGVDAGERAVSRFP